MRTIEEAKNDAAQYLISQFFPQYIQPISEINDQYIQCQSASVMSNTMIPKMPYLATEDVQSLSAADSKCQEVTNEQTSDSPTSSNNSNKTLVQSPYVLSQPVSHMPSITQQFIIDSNGKSFIKNFLNKIIFQLNFIFILGQYILYPTQAFY